MRGLLKKGVKRMREFDREMKKSEKKWLQLQFKQNIIM